MIDLSKHVNETFGKWTVLGQSESKRSGGRGKMTRMLSVQCECGLRTTRRAVDVINGRTPNCPSCVDRLLTSERTVRKRPAPRVKIEGKPEVCPCVYFDGRLVHACGDHGGEA